MSLKNLSDSELVDSTRRALQSSREAEVNVLKHFREIEERRLWVHCSSLYKYLGQTFNLTNDQIYPRLQAMRLIVVIPEVEQKLEMGELHITTVLKAHQAFRAESKKRKVSTDEKRAVLSDLENLSTKSAEKVLAEKYPLTHKLPEKIKPVAKNLNIIQFYADDEMIREIEDLKARYSHQMPEGKTEDLIKILIRIAKRKPDPRRPSRFKTKIQPRANVKSAEVHDLTVKQPAGRPGDNNRANSRQKPTRYGPIDYRWELEGQDELLDSNIQKVGDHTSKRITIRPRSRYIPADVKRQMEKSRSEGCIHLGPNGKPCGSLHFLQLDHIIEFRRGGANTTENLRWLCGFHNLNRGETKPTL